MRASEFKCAVAFALAEIKRVGRLSRLPPEIQTVVLVHAAQGVIDNGGLQYFFEADFPGRPPYSVFVDAYRTIGANGEAAALAEAAKLFPFNDPHKFQQRRNRYLDRFQAKFGHRADSPFEPYTKQLCGNKEVWRRLKLYISRNAKSFPRAR